MLNARRILICPALDYDLSGGPTDNFVALENFHVTTERALFYALLTPKVSFNL